MNDSMDAGWYERETDVRAPRGAIAWAEGHGWLFDPVETDEVLAEGTALVLDVDDDGWCRDVAGAVSLAHALRTDGQVHALAVDQARLEHALVGMRAALAGEL